MKTQRVITATVGLALTFLAAQAQAAEIKIFVLKSREDYP
jgi:hypothetical protein